MKKNQKNEQNKDIYVNQNLLNIISPSGISFDNNYADIGEGVGKIFCISRYPSELDYGWLSDIVNLPGAAATVEYRYSPEDIMIAQFNRRISELKSARETERKESEIQRYEHQIEDLKNLINRISVKREPVGFFNVLLHIQDANEELLAKRIRNINSRVRIHECDMHFLKFKQRQALESIPELQPQTSKEIVNDELIDKIQKGMDLQILNDGGDRAYYSPKTDSVHLPEKDTFYNSYAYNATALHELSHATGAEKRLNRDIRNVFGTEKYAYEELVAEISACFMSEHIQIEQTEEHVNNHKAYIQSWTKALSEKPEMLMKAIRDAEKAANYLEYHAEILSKEEYQETLTLHENEETPTPGNTSEKMVEKTANPITREADLKANGYKLTPALKKHMDRLDQLTGRKNSVKDIYKAYKTHDFHGDPETEKTIKSIGKIFQRQEMQIKAVIPER